MIANNAYFILCIAMVIASMVFSAPVYTTITSNSEGRIEVTKTLRHTDYVVGLQTGSVVYWSATINAESPNATVTADVGNDVVTFKKGIFINLADNQGTIPSYIFLSGQIIDAGTVNNVKGLVLMEIPDSNEK
eukprot:gene31624-38218_t